jgi:hypothetical protein
VTIVLRTVLKRLTAVRWLYRSLKALQRLAPAERAFIEHNRRIWTGPAPSGAREILTDLWPVPQTVISYAYVLNALARKHGAAIRAFSDDGSVRLSPTYRIYRSFGVSGLVVPDARASRSLRRDVRDCLARAQNKDDLLHLTYRGINIGVAVIETYLRRFSEPTVDFDDPRLAALMCELFALADYWDARLSTGRTAAVVVSHDCYESAVLCRIAYKHGVPAVLPNAWDITVSRKPHDSFEYFNRLPEIFQSLPAALREQGERWGREQIEARVTGAPKGMLPYMTTSAFTEGMADRPRLRQSGKLKVLIATHCFFDNPHHYGGMIFPDFYTWIEFLGRLSEETDYDWYLKTHPDPLPGTDSAIRRLLDRFPAITLLPSDTSGRQLVAEGLDFVLTCYGTVGEEYPYLGVQVVTAGYNPRIAYRFNHHADTREKYERLIRSLPELRLEGVERIPEFVFMRLAFTVVDDFMFRSYRGFNEQSIEDQHGLAGYQRFLDEFTPTMHDARVDVIAQFLDSGGRNLFEFVAGRPLSAVVRDDGMGAAVPR